MAVGPHQDWHRLRWMKKLTQPLLWRAPPAPKGNQHRH
jgi:hypothetical protein